MPGHRHAYRFDDDDEVEDLTGSLDEDGDTARMAPRAMGTPLPFDAPLPPELAGQVYSLVRRLALQAELGAGERVLRVALAELTSASSARLCFVGDDGEPWSLSGPTAGGEEHGAPIAKLAEIAGKQRPWTGTLVTGPTLIVPFVAGGRTIALAVLGRAARLGSFGALEGAIAGAAARECAGLLVQLLGDHARKGAEAAADKKSLYRPEALASQRARGNEGSLVEISPRWVRRAYPVTVGLVVIALIAAGVARVPTWSAGAAVVTIEGLEVTAPAQGTVDAIEVEPGQAVKAGDVLARLGAVDEAAELVLAQTERDNALTSFLFDSADEMARSQLGSADARRERARAKADARVVKAPRDGVVSDVRVRPGQALMPGDHIATIVEPGAEPIVTAFLPGQDRPRLRLGMPLQLDLRGYTKVRERAVIIEVGTEVIGPNEARRTVGAQVADSLNLNGPVVIVRARLPARTFVADNHRYHFHDGMLGNGEVEVESKPFMVTLVPSLEKLPFFR
jgi:multidrug resistance efflux pump